MALILNVDYWPAITLYSCVVRKCDHEVYGILRISEHAVEFYCYDHFFAAQHVFHDNIDRETWRPLRFAWA